MSLLTVKEAAQFLNLNEEVLRRKAKAGDIPGRKTGVWLFYEPDLVAWLRGGYHRRWQTLLEEKSCSTSAEIPGTSRSSDGAKLFRRATESDHDTN